MLKKSSFSVSNFINNPRGEIDKIEDNIGSNISYSLAKSVTKPTDEIKDYTTKDKLMFAALSGIGALAVTGVLSKIFKTKMPIPLHLANAARAAATGYFVPDIANAIRGEVRGEISPEETKEFLRNVTGSERKVFNEAQEISELYGGIGKRASLIGGAASLAGKTIGGVGRQLWKRKIPVAIAGSLYAGYKGYSHIKGPRSSGNYTTFLRNQVLAGNVNQDELSQRDLTSVRGLGMR